MIILKTNDQINYIHKSCKITAHVLKNLKKEIKEGITTKYLNILAEELCYERGGIPGFKGYQGYPFAVCASKNNEIVHGFPDDVPLKSGDILSIDFGTIFNGWYSDSAFTVGVGKIDARTKKFLRITEECFLKGLDVVVEYNRVGDISHAIQTHAESNGYSVVRSLVGHGVGRKLHEEPQIPNWGNKHEGMMLKSGMVFAIEPILNMGIDKILPPKNGWTTKTFDGGLSAHFEHTVAIVNGKAKVLTKRD